MAARVIGRLNALAVSRAQRPGLYADGGGLYLQITRGITDGKSDPGKPGAKSWIFRYAREGKERHMGLGPSRDVSLADARTKAGECRRLLADGIDPLTARDAEQEAKKLSAATATTFKQCGERYIAAHRAGWRNAKHGAQWESTLATYVYPIIGDLAVGAIDTALVMKVLEQPIAGEAKEAPTPLWSARPETASRVRGRIEVILDWAAARRYRQGENPARWRGHLDCYSACNFDPC